MWDWNLASREMPVHGDGTEMPRLRARRRGNSIPGGMVRIDPSRRPGGYARAGPGTRERRRRRIWNEYRMLAADGSWRWVLSRGKSIACSEKGGAIRVIGTTTDITERKERCKLRCARAKRSSGDWRIRRRC